MKYWSYWKTRNKVLFIVIMSLLALFLIFKIIIPIIKWNLPYDEPKFDTPEKVIEYYIEAIDERNPKKEILAHFGEPGYEESMFEYTFSNLLWCKLESIELMPDDTDEDLEEDFGFDVGEKYVVKYDVGFLFGLPIGNKELADEIMYINVRQDEESGNYYIFETWYFNN